MIAFDSLAVVAGLVLLWIAADQFVAGAVRLSVAWRISTVVIGALVIGFGTSAPEIFVSTIAAAGGNLDVAVGNVTGSNIANMTLVIGIVVLMRPIKVSSGVIRREAPISTAAVVLFGVCVVGGSLHRWQGAILLVALVAVLVYMVRMNGDAGDSDDALAANVEEFAANGGDVRIAAESIRVVLGLAGTLVGAWLLVFGATGIAEFAGLSEGFIGLTVVGIGTSLPELATGIQAARRGESDLVLGNVLGSNVFNSLAVGGLAALVGPGPILDPSLAGTATYLMVGVSLLVWLAMWTQHRISRWEAIVLLAIYAAVLPLLAG